MALSARISDVEALRARLPWTQSRPNRAFAKQLLMPHDQLSLRVGSCPRFSTDRYRVV